MNRLLGMAMVWVALMGSITIGSGESGGDRIMSLAAALPAWGYLGFRCRREIRRIRAENRMVQLDREQRQALGPGELLDVLAQLTTGKGERLQCSVQGHATGHRCLPVSQDCSLADLVRALRSRYGTSAILVIGGNVHPTLDATSGLSLLAPFGRQVRDMRGWGRGVWRIGAGTVEDSHGSRRVVLVDTGKPSPGESRSDAP
ncbi:hypothetical protein [Streptomyces mesophilus]|uniref:hypothetical protein n=1 Tax=Streptomyces mesophilus TaxID=1775132 RepID=UPI00331811C6